MNRDSDPLFGHLYKQPGDPTIQDVCRACAMIESLFGQPEVHNLLSRFGVANLTDLWIGSYRGLIEFAAQCAEWKTPPSAGWTGGLPNNVARLLGE